ncbi:MAG: hypothetical protein KAS73_14455 [Candidatus Sabulitectum sp.]|nr:hypothetical protein [Candidatus Sabulitectum sp.]
MKKGLLILLIVFAGASAYGLEPSGFNLVGYPDYASGFHPEFSSRASFSVSSSSYGSYGEGTYIGSMHFSLHHDVDATVEMGYSRLMRFSGGEETGRILGGFQLNWRPSENSLFSVSYRGMLPESNLNLGGF